MGKLTSPLGTEYTGFKVTLIGDNPNVERTYEDIDRILHQNKVAYKIHEERDSDGHFKSFTVTT